MFPLALFAALTQTPTEAGLKAYHAGRCQEATSWFETAVNEAPADGPAHHNLASALFLCGQYDAAERHYRRALELRLTDGARAVTHNNLAVLLRNRAAAVEARQHAQKALALEDRAQFWQTLAEVNRLEGDVKAARGALDEALRRKPDRWLHAAILQTRGGLALEEGALAEALVDLEASVKIFREEAGPGHVRTLLAQSALAVAWSAGEKLEEAGDLLVENVRLTELALGPDHPRVATAANNLAQVRRKQKRYEDADPLYRKAIGAWERTYGPNHPDVARGLHNLASMFAEQGKVNGAEKLYRRAWEIADRALGPLHAQTRLHRRALEELYLAAGRKGALEQMRRGVVKTENR